MNTKALNVKYALVNIGFYAMLAGSLGFAFNYLNQSGFETGIIGTIMCFVNLVAILLGPIAGSIVDRSEKVSIKGFVAASMAIVAFISVLLLVFPAGSPLILLDVIIIFSAAYVGMPMLNSMAFAYEEDGGVINYGLGRGIGSASYAVASIFIGQLWADFGRDTLPLWIIGSALATAAFTLLMPAEPSPSKAGAEEAAENITVVQFFGKYRRLISVIVALVLLFFGQNVFTTYIGAVLGDIMVGASESEIAAVQGNALFIQAMCELPAMFAFTFIMKKFTINQIMAISSVFFVVKYTVLLFAGDVMVYYLGMALQGLSFAVLIPAVTYFANAEVNTKDANKSQAIFGATNTLGSLLASLVAGWVFQLVSIHVGLEMAVLACVIGSITMIFSMVRLGKEKQAQEDLA